MPSQSDAATTVSGLITAEIPQILWHYTSFSGLMGIVGNGNIFASDIRFLNDAQELIHARTLIEEIARQERAKKKDISRLLSNALRRQLSWIFDKGPLSANMLQVFVACFSEARDQLSQWRGYSKQTTGISLGFDLRDLRKHSERRLVVFGPCIYEDELKRALLKEVVRNLFRQMEEMISNAYDAGLKSFASAQGSREDFDGWIASGPIHAELAKKLDKSTMNATYDLLRIAALMKHSAFREEKEWRLVIPLLKGFNDKDTALIFSSDGTSLIPRFVQTLNPEAAIIKEVVLGPGSHPCSTAAVAQYFASMGMKPVISLSAAPYRRKE